MMLKAKSSLSCLCVICLVVCFFGCGDSSHDAAGLVTEHVQKDDTYETTGTLSSSQSDSSDLHIHDASTNEAGSPISATHVEDAVIDYAQRLQQMQDLADTNINALAHVVVTREQDPWRWLNRINKYTVSKETHCAITNALAQVYDQAQLPAERLYVLRDMAKVLERAYDLDGALDVLLRIPDDTDLSCSFTLDEYALNKYYAALLYRQLQQTEEANRMFHELTTYESDMARAYGYSNLAHYYAQTDLDKARETLEIGRTRIDPNASWYNMLNDMEGSLHVVHDAYQRDRSRQLTAESESEFRQIRRDIFWAVPGAQERMRSFRGQYKPTTNQ